MSHPNGRQTLDDKEALEATFGGQLDLREYENVAHYANGETAALTPLSPAAQLRLLTKKMVALIKHMWQPRTITIQKDHDQVRIVTFKGKKVDSWQTIQLGDFSSTNGHKSDQSIQDFPSSLKSLKNLTSLIGTRVILGLPAHASLLRRFSIKKVKQRYLKQIILSELQNTIPFPLEETDHYWSVSQKSLNQDVFVVVTPKKSTDSHALEIKEYKLGITGLYAKAQAMALASGIEEAIVVDLGPTWADIVLVKDGYPEIIHHSELAQPSSSDSAIADSLARSIEQVSTYSQARGTGTSKEATPVLITGHGAADHEFLKSIQQKINRKMLTFSPTMYASQGFPIQEYAVNLGLVRLDSLRPRPLKKPAPFTTGLINILPERHRSVSLHLLPTAVFACLLLLGLAIVPLVNQIRGLESTKPLIGSKVESLERQSRLSRISNTRDNLVTSRIQDTASYSSTLDSVLQGLSAATEKLSNQMQTATVTSANGYKLVEISTLQTGSSAIVLTGLAPSYDDVLAYADGLHRSGLYEDVRVLRLESSSGANLSAQSLNGSDNLVVFQIKAYTSSGDKTADSTKTPVAQKP